MDQKDLISHVDTALANLIWECIENDSATTATVSTREQISFSSPKTAISRGNKKLTIFLYNITEETVAGNTNASFALHYLITPFTENDKDDHALLAKIIQMFLDKPFLEVADAENKSELAVKIDSLSLKELSRLWMALDAPLRLSVSLTVSSAEPLRNSQTQMTTEETPQTQELHTNRVTQLYQAVLKTFTEQSAGWRNRNMLVKQWVLQDFEKNSSMSVDEVQSMLSSLGDKLEHGESATQFTKSLNQLARYYQHQLDELKGLHKISHKQTENIETITTWIKDVKALVDALAT
jgi:hypothetical protein